MIRWILRHLGASFAGKVLRGVAEGEYGEGPKAAYWWLAGKKRVIGFILGAASVVALALHHEAVAASLGSAGALLYGSGLIDKDWRTPPLEVQNWHFWVLARDWGIEFHAVLLAVAARFTDCDADVANILAHAHLTCFQGLAVVTALSALYVWATGEAITAQPPKAG